MRVWRTEAGGSARLRQMCWRNDGLVASRREPRIAQLQPCPADYPRVCGDDADDESRALQSRRRPDSCIAGGRRSGVRKRPSRPLLQLYDRSPEIWNFAVMEARAGIEPACKD